MLSFEVKALFPSMPARKALRLLEEWLNTHQDTAETRVEVKLQKKLATASTKETYCRLRLKFYSSTSAAPIRKSLSPIPCQLKMSEGGEH